MNRSSSGEISYHTSSTLVLCHKQEIGTQIGNCNLTGRYTMSSWYSCMVARTKAGRRDSVQRELFHVPTFFSCTDRKLIILIIRKIVPIV